MQLRNGIVDDLHRFGARIVNEIDALGDECEAQPPRLEQYSAWGERQDRLWTCDAWKKQKAISAEEGLIAAGYERHQWQEHGCAREIT